jgi:predicted flavoprotein YhiN
VGKRQVVIIGGGASGMVAAIAAARQGARVTVLEHKDTLGKKILSTGNGRCNLTNLYQDPGCYRCSQPGFVQQVTGHFPVADTLKFFEGLGILTRDRNGYVYPYSEQASSVLDALVLELKVLGVRVETGCVVRKTGRQEQVQSREQPGKPEQAAGREQPGKPEQVQSREPSRNPAAGGFRVETDRGCFRADALVLATGSKAAPATGSDGSGYELAERLGHRIILPLPALVQLHCAGKIFKQVAGVRCQAQVTVRADGKALAEDTGELQLTDYGISGIPTFQVSRFASRALEQGKKVEAVVDFFPSWNKGELEGWMDVRRKQFPYRKAGDLMNGVLHRKLSAGLLREAGISLDRQVAEIPEGSWKRFDGSLKAFRVTVTKTSSFDKAQVCCGGIDTREVNGDTMESRLVPGLYLAGEILDVDGICGGYNLQWAWSSGYVAGRHAGGGV